MTECDAAPEATETPPTEDVQEPAGPSPSPEVSPDAGQEGDQEGQTKKEKKAKKEKKEKEEPQGKRVPKLLKDSKMGNLLHDELDWIWIGDAEDARDREALKKHNVRYILNCTHVRTKGGVSNFHEKDPWFDYCRLEMGDNSTERLANHYDTAWDYFEKVRVREDGGILVHCQQGVSRSCSMVMIYLMKYYRYRYDEARALIQRSRRQACPNEGFEQQLRELDELLFTTNGYEKRPPPRNKKGGARSGAAVGPSVGPAGPSVGPARGPAGPSVGPARGPTGPSVGPARGPAGPSVGPARGPAGPPVGPQKGPAGPAVGPAGPPRGPVGPAVGPAVGPSKPSRPAAGPAVGPSKPKKPKTDVTA